MASHNYKLYLYFIIARASRALSNIASDYAVNKLRKYDFLPGQSGCHSLPSPTASPLLLLFFPSYFSSPSIPSLSALACLILLLLLLATLELCSSWRHFRARWRVPLLLFCQWAGGACQGACAGIYWRWAAAAPSAAAAALGLSCLRCCRACLRVF